MATDSAFWRDLESRFRELLNIPEAARLTGMYCDGQWNVHDGPRDQRDGARLHQLFPPLARAGAIAAGTPNGADALDVWLSLLWTDTPDSHAVESHHAENGVWMPDEHQGGWIQNLVLASADYCVVRAARAFESDMAAAASSQQAHATAPSTAEPKKPVGKDLTAYGLGPDAIRRIERIRAEGEHSLLLWRLKEPLDFLPEYEPFHSVHGRIKLVFENNTEFDEFCFHNHILAVFLAFTEEACGMGRLGKWDIAQARSYSLAFLRDFARESYDSFGFDRQGNRLRAVYDQFGELRPEVAFRYRLSQGWSDFEHGLLEVCDAAPTPATFKANSNSPTEPKPDESRGKDAGLAVNAAEDGGANRRAAVDAFLLRCKQETAVSATRTHIWRAVGHGTARQFQFWQASDPKATAPDDQNFRRILAMSPADFETLLKKKRII